MVSSWYRRGGKRIIDFLGACSLLLLLSPVLVLSAVLVFLFLDRRILFKQLRGGYQGQVFLLYKFTTMTSKTDEHGVLLSDEERLTRLGRILRITSIDELPGLVNVVKGQMSLIGPRPFIADYLLLYSEEQKRRHLVRPGITGWAQVNGRNAISWEEKFKLDVFYVDHLSIWLDIKILLLTVIKVVRRHGISQSSTVTMERFVGSRSDD
ncbi:MAG: sugar transferase [Francisellaceae bacterium]